jgi:hypothetical protein
VPIRHRALAARLPRFSGTTQQSIQIVARRTLSSMNERAISSANCSLPGGGTRPTM